MQLRSGLFYQKYPEGHTESITYTGPGRALSNKSSVQLCMARLFPKDKATLKVDLSRLGKVGSASHS